MLSMVEILEVLLEAAFYFNTKHPEKSNQDKEHEIQIEEKENIDEIITENRANTPSGYIV